MATQITAASENPYKSVTSVIGTKDSIFEDFFSFLTKGNVLDLAVGTVLGTAFTGLVTALSKDILVPIVGSLVQIDMSNDFYVYKKGQKFPYQTLEQAEQDGAIVIRYGEVIEKFITFVVQALAMYFLIRAYKATSSRISRFY